jgi:acyl-CoA thioester hydrolase
VAAGAVFGLGGETQGRALSGPRLPQAVHAGLRVARLGASSVRYEIGIFADDQPHACAQGHFIHVYVDRATRRPTPLPPPLRAALERILA